MFGLPGTGIGPSGVWVVKGTCPGQPLLWQEWHCALTCLSCGDWAERVCVCVCLGSQSKPKPPIGGLIAPWRFLSHHVKGHYVTWEKLFSFNLIPLITSRTCPHSACLPFTSPEHSLTFFFIQRPWACFRGMVSSETACSQHHILITLCLWSLAFFYYCKKVHP